MALYKLNESSDSLLDSIDILLNEAYDEVYADDLINQESKI